MDYIQGMSKFTIMENRIILFPSFTYMVKNLDHHLPQSHNWHDHVQFFWQNLHPSTTFPSFLSAPDRVPCIFYTKVHVPVTLIYSNSFFPHIIVKTQSKYSLSNDQKVVIFPIEKGLLEHQKS